MLLPTNEQLLTQLKDQRISTRLIRDIRYTPQSIMDEEFRDFLAVTTKSGNEGVLLYAGAVVPFSLMRKGANAQGRAEAIICDICATWQRGSNAARITFASSASTTHSFLVCADLNCSLHVRDKTPESKLSRTQLRENISPEARVARLHARLTSILGHVQ